MDREQSGIEGATAMGEDIHSRVQQAIGTAGDRCAQEKEKMIIINQKSTLWCIKRLRFRGAMISHSSLSASYFSTIARGPSSKPPIT